ncbi:MAG: thiamine pyridinylase [Clostridia bacterium]|nr:thiamine pyridinylase [Clostridia bacterium]
MMIKKSKVIIVFTVILYLSICFVAFADKEAHDAAEQEALNVSLYKVLPDYDSFEETVEACWSEIHPEAGLNFVDWDCYSGKVPEDLDVFVFDTTSLDAFAQKGYLLALSAEDIQDYDDLIPSFVEGCRVDGEIYAVPQILCTDLLYTRKDDDDLKNVQNIDDLYGALGNSGLLLDKQSPIIQVAMYLQALVDETQRYTDHYPPIEEGTLSPEAISSLERISDMHQTDSEGLPEDGEWYYYARRFSEDMGRAYIGYSESMDVMGDNASDMDFRLFSMTDGKDIPVFYVDAAAVNAKISDDKKSLALDFLNMITGKDMMVRASVNGGDPRYLLATRYSIYDALAPDYPIYAELKKVASVPNACVFRIKPDGDAYLEESAKHVDLLPRLSE